MADALADLLDAHDGLFLIKDTLQLSGRFVAVQSFIHFLKRQLQVVYVCIDQSPSSLKTRLKKSGLNPAALLQSGQLRIFDAPAELDDNTPLPLLEELRAAVASRGDAFAGTAIIVDDLSVLAAVAGGQRQWGDFLRGCRRLMQSTVGRCWVQLVAHEDIQGDVATWLPLLEHHCEVVVLVEPVAGGMADIHGQATITLRGATSAAKVLQPSPGPAQQLASSYRPSQRLFFRAGDTAIRWVPQATVHGT